MNLDPFQIQGASFLANAPGKGALLADEPGLGKTRQAIEAVCRSGFNAAVVCPASAIGVWRKEIAESAAAEMGWQIASYARASLIKGRFDVLIIDEAHYCKTRDSARTKLLFGEKCDGAGGLVERADHVILLSGTPTPNNPSEIWPLARAVFPDAISLKMADGTLRPMAYWAFVKKFCTTEENWLGHIKITGGKNLDELRARLAPHVLRRRKVDVLADLPAVRFSELPVEAGQKGRPLYTRETFVIQEALRDKGAAGLAEIAPHVARLRRVTGLAKVEGCADWIKDWFDGGGGKLVVFAHHRDVIHALQDRFHADKISHVTVDGSVRDREGPVALFQDSPKCQVFLGHIQAAGTAITLTAASTLLFVEQSWVPSDNDQAWQRIHRIGQKNACSVRFATLAGSIDEDISRALARKMESINALWNASACA